MVEIRSAVVGLAFLKMTSLKPKLPNEKQRIVTIHQLSA